MPVTNPHGLYWAVKFVFTDDEDLPEEWHNLDGVSLVVETLEDEIPQPNYVFVDVPGKESAIDLSRAVSGKVSTGQGKLTLKLTGYTSDYANMTNVSDALTTINTIRGNVSGRPCECSIGYWQKSGTTWTMVDVWTPDENAGELYVTGYEVMHGRYSMTFEWVYKVDA